MKQRPNLLRLISLILPLYFILQSCQTDPPNYLWEGKTGQLGELYVCCQVPGNNCYNKGTWGFTPNMRAYVENNDLRGFFQNEDWRYYFPELIGHEDIVDQIIAANPKGQFLKNDSGIEIAFVILKDSTKLALSDNVYVGFKSSPDCDKAFEGL